MMAVTVSMIAGGILIAIQVKWNQLILATSAALLLIQTGVRAYVIFDFDKSTGDEKESADVLTLFTEM